MGNLFSKKFNFKDKLINLENEILKIENDINELNSTNYPFLALLTVFIPILTYFCYSFDLFFNFLPSFLSILMPSIFISILLFFFYNFIKNKIKLKKQKKLIFLKEERKKMVEKCKNDVNFSITKNLIEKYEDEEVRDTFFNQILKKKKSQIDLVTDFVLANDPTKSNALICVKCGIHNGLVDSKNEEFKVFYCFSCKYKNVRVNKDKLQSP
jgi:hypothetical protein